MGPTTTPPSATDILHRYLRGLPRDLEWKLQGPDEGHLRNPMTHTGTDLLGLVRHVTGVEAGYLLTEDDQWWVDYRDRLTGIAESFRGADATDRNGGER